MSGNATLEDWWTREFQFEPKARGRGFGFRRRDGKMVIEVLEGTRSFNELTSQLIQLLMLTESHQEQVCLVLNRPALSRARIEQGWNAMTRMFNEQYAGRLAIVVIGKEEIWTIPESLYLRQVGENIKQQTHTADSGRQLQIKEADSNKYYETLKVLMVRWLTGQGAFPIGKLAATVGCSYPTMRLVLQRLYESKCLRKHSDRSIELARFPTAEWLAMLTLRNTLRKPIRFVDVSGQPPDPHRLLRRLEKMKPANIAAGGVASARYWHADFDLNGVPRIDLTVHVHHGIVDLDFLRKLDPALQRTNDPDSSSVLVLHPLLRAANLFETSENQPLPLADPVETALDLCEMGFTQQADQLFNHLRSKVRT